jgi:hypothetical protein
MAHRATPRKHEKITKKEAYRRTTPAAARAIEANHAIRFLSVAQAAL